MSVPGQRSPGQRIDTCPPAAGCRSGRPAGWSASIRTRCAAGPTRVGSRCSSRPGGTAASTAGRSSGWRRSRRPRRAAAGQPRRELGAADARLPAELRDATRRPAQVAADDTGDRERYRQDGRRLVEALVAHLDADPTDDAARATAEAEATALVDDLARRLSARGDEPDRGGRPVRRRPPAVPRPSWPGSAAAARSMPPGSASLYEDASGLLDRLLLRLIATYQEAAR